MSASLACNRRGFLLRLAALSGGLPLLLKAPAAFAQDLPKLPLDNAQAKALAYTEDAATAAAHASFKAGSNCENCQFLQGTAGAAQRPCQLFPGFSVSAKGWCSAWSKKA